MVGLRSRLTRHAVAARSRSTRSAYERNSHPLTPPSAPNARTHRDSNEPPADGTDRFDIPTELGYRLVREGIERMLMGPCGWVLTDERSEIPVVGPGEAVVGGMTKRSDGNPTFARSTRGTTDHVQSVGMGLTDRRFLPKNGIVKSPTDPSTISTSVKRRCTIAIRLYPPHPCPRTTAHRARSHRRQPSLDRSPSEQPWLDEQHDPHRNHEAPRQDRHQHGDRAGQPLTDGPCEPPATHLCEYSVGYHHR